MLTLLAIAYGSLCFYGLLLSERQIFIPPPASYSDGDDILKLDVGNGDRLSAIHLHNPNATYTLLLSHGNGSDIGQLRHLMEQWYNLGFSILAYDYRGYGTSDGNPSERNVYEDVNAAYRYLTEDVGVPSDRIIAYGLSLGGGPSIYLASREKIAGVIVEGTFTTVFRVVTRVPLVPFEKFDNLGRVTRIDCPLMVAHGRLDNTVPFWHGKALFAAAQEPKFFLEVPHAGHVHLLDAAPTQYVATLQEFLAVLSPLLEHLP